MTFQIDSVVRQRREGHVGLLNEIGVPKAEIGEYLSTDKR
jgi:hypothetical protein